MDLGLNWAMDEFFACFDNIPRARKGTNLLHQLQHCRGSDRPVSEIHFTFLALQTSMQTWQISMQNNIFNLLKQQKTWVESLVSTMDKHFKFHNKWMSRLHEFHIRQVPKHDHRAVEMAKEAFDKYIVLVSKGGKEKSERQEAVSKTKQTNPARQEKVKSETKKNNPACVACVDETPRIRSEREMRRCVLYAFNLDGLVDSIFVLVCLLFNLQGDSSCDERIEGDRRSVSRKR